MNEELVIRQKKKLRLNFKEIRDLIPEERRQKVREKLLSDLWPKLSPYPQILSFMSKPEEIDLFEINRLLAQEGRLLLTRIEDLQLVPYKALEINDLKPSPKWNFYEPDPKICSKVPYEQINLVLVPALAFDSAFNRIGLGFGYYDRFLSEISSNIPTWGLGFVEQFTKKPLPIQSHDWALTQVFLY